MVVKSCILPLKSFYKISVEGITLMPKRDSQNVLLQKYLACQGAELYCVLLLQSKKIILYLFHFYWESKGEDVFMVPAKGRHRPESPYTHV